MPACARDCWTANPHFLVADIRDETGKLRTRVRYRYGELVKVLPLPMYIAKRRAARRIRPALALLVQNGLPIYPSSVQHVDRRLDERTAMLGIIHLVRARQLHPQLGTLCPHCGEREFYGDCPERANLLRAQTQAGGTSCSACELEFALEATTLYAVFAASEKYQQRLHSRPRRMLSPVGL